MFSTTRIFVGSFPFLLTKSFWNNFLHFHKMFIRDYHLVTGTSINFSFVYSNSSFICISSSVSPKTTPNTAFLRTLWFFWRFSSSYVLKATVLLIYESKYEMSFITKYGLPLKTTIMFQHPSDKNVDDDLLASSLVVIELSKWQSNLMIQWTNA